ncbi:MAG TPA: DUF2231 domain-containing protein [Terriglobales bacterium]
MSSPASIKKHPIHPMLVALPIGLWLFALICDVAAIAGGSPIWSNVARYCIGGGIIGAILAAVPGLIDYFSIDEAQMKRIATWHLGVNLTAVVIYAVNWWLRLRLEATDSLPLLLSIAGIALIGWGGWLGGEMVYVKGMAVDAMEKLAREKSSPSSRRAA